MVGFVQKRELPILHFLWRWKVATTSAIYIRFQPDYKWATVTVYKRMRHLKMRGLVDTKYVDSGAFIVWTLTKKGFGAVLKSLPPLCEEGYASECLEHDLYTLAVQYGDWLPKGTANDVVFFTEQELRRRLPETFFSWLPPVKVHRPDGYWNFPKTYPTSLIALEVEINRKSYSEYVGYGNFYNRYTTIESVLWVVQSCSLAKKIREAANERVGAFRDIHNFALLSDVIENGWSANIFMGPNQKSKIRDFLNQLRGINVGTVSEQYGDNCSKIQILDHRHRLAVSSSYVPHTSLPPP